MRKLFVLSICLVAFSGLQAQSRKSPKTIQTSKSLKTATITQKEGSSAARTQPVTVPSSRKAVARKQESIQAPRGSRNL